KVAMTYLCDLPVDELIARVKGTPEGSLILYVRYSQDEPGKALDPSDALALIAQYAKVPIYSLARPSLLRGSVGGYDFSLEASTAKMAEMGTFAYCAISARASDGSS